MNYFPLVSAIISAIFAVLLAIQWRRRRKPYQLIWTISLVTFFMTTFLEFYADYVYYTVPSSIGWTELTYKLYYVFSASMVALMGAGSLYLLTHLPAGKYFLYFTIAVSVPLFVLGFLAPIGDSLVNAVVTKGGTEVAGLAMPSYVRIFSYLLNIPGGIAIIGGALYSFALDRTRKYNLLIAVGGLYPFAGGSQTLLGNTTLFYVLETAGIILLFAGFVLSWEYIRSREAKVKSTPK